MKSEITNPFTNEKNHMIYSSFTTKVNEFLISQAIDVEKAKIENLK